MEHDYKNIISHIDIDRGINAIEYSSFEGFTDESVADFVEDIEGNNDSIELHLIKSKSYREALILHLIKNDSNNNSMWREFLKEEQKTFGGSKIFYISKDSSKLLVLSLPNEMKNKLNMVLTRLNKINEKIARLNTRIKKENIDLFAERQKSKDNNKKKDEIINFINENLRV